jgi:hypothetical protein
MAFRPERAMTREPQRRANRRLALVLASIALVFFLGFVVNRALFAS